jgi:hypothetical protein
LQLAPKSLNPFAADGSLALGFDRNACTLHIVCATAPESTVETR